MDLKARIAGHFGGADVHRIEVPEWGEAGEPLVVCYRRANLRDIAEASRLADGDQFIANARLVAAKALDTDGKPLFRMVDATFLCEEADPAVVSRLAGAITSGVPTTAAVEAAEKN